MTVRYPRKILCSLILLTLPLLAFSFACGGVSESDRWALLAADPEALESEAQSIDKSLICPVCPGETIDQAQAELASQMRGVVREKLGQGWSRQQILDFYVDRYGEVVLAAPTKGGVNLLVWVLPFVGLAGGALALYFIVRAMRRSAGHQEYDSELERFLDQVDRDLGSASITPATPPAGREES